MKEGARQAQVLYSTQEGVPFSYILPVSVAKVLGKEVFEKSKKDVFSYADILETIIGVQEYGTSPKEEDPSKGFTPLLKADGYKENFSHKFCKQPLRGTVLPTTEISFINKPLWSILDQMRNPSINEMYTALKPNNQGKVLPTLVVRQIPFSTDSIKQHPGFPLTRFLSMPRWKVSPSMVKSLDVGRSNATRFNMVHVYGNASVYENSQLVSLPRQIVQNPPIVDFLDIARSGLKPYMQTVSCALPDLIRIENDGQDGKSIDSNARVWMEAIADWTMGSHLSLNGTIELAGIQEPIAEGDNLEFEGVAYHIESFSINCSESSNGDKNFTTTLSLSNGMPIDQETEYKKDFPRYPGFGKTASALGLFSNNGEWSLIDINSNVEGDPAVVATQDPGRTIDRGS
jgi:hypothetical protein